MFLAPITHVGSPPAICKVGMYVLSAHPMYGELLVLTGIREGSESILIQSRKLQATQIENPKKNKQQDGNAKEKKMVFLSDDVSSSPNQSYRRTVGGVGSCSSNPKSDLQRQLALYEQHDVR